MSVNRDFSAKDGSELFKLLIQGLMVPVGLGESLDEDLIFSISFMVILIL